MTGTNDWSTDQQAALDAVLRWRDQARGEDRHLSLGGYAGTGKTTLVSHLVDLLPGVACVALCGKAAHVLRAKGAPAQTVHSLIYVPRKTPQGIRFCKRRYLDGVRTIVVDESSMIDHVLFRDLVSFRLPVLFVGDHGQLEPIGTNPGLMKDPDVRLETIHRQALGNPIIRLAAAFREGRPVLGRWADKAGHLRLAGRGDFDRLVSPNAQIICGFNRTRHRVNSRVRELMGYTHLVEPGDKLVCLRNNKVSGIFNGQQVVVLDVAGEFGRAVDLMVQADDGRSFTLPVLREQFGRDLIQDFRSTEVALMDYGYCLTAHKAQGAEWPAVLVLEEIARAWDPRRWRYTCATRAKETLTYCW
jgi:exodeoxyribonuclease-5